MMTFIRCAVVALMLAPVPGVAEDFDTGNAAAQAGDFATALQVFRQLAEQGSARAQHRLGTHYRKGIGVPQDYAEALRWYQMAAEQRNTDAQHGLGSMYEEGQGVPQDYAKAARWYRIAAEQGHFSAQVKLGNMYLQGKGRLQDYTTAHMWFNIAVANGAGPLGTEGRGIAASRMATADITEAQQRAKRCMESGYQDCD